MNDQTLLKIIKKIEKQVVSILLVRGLIKLKNEGGAYTFKNSVTTNKSKKILGIKEVEVISDQDVLEYRSLFPKGRKSSVAEVKKRMMEHMEANKNITVRNMINAAKAYTQATDEQYVTSAHYFLHKKGHGSKIEEWLEEDFDDNPDYRNQLGN